MFSDELCAPEVITTELIDGTPLEKFFDAPYETRHDIAEKIMRLCLSEMFALRCMQTDPNWANFFYNPNTKQVSSLYVTSKKGFYEGKNKKVGNIHLYGRSRRTLLMYDKINIYL